MASEDSIYGLILQLCNHHVPPLKPFYGRDINCNLPDVQITKKKKLAKKLHKIAYSTLLKFTQIGRNGKFSNFEGFSEIHSLLAIVYDMRVSRKFDDANALETHLNKIKGEKNCISDDARNCLRLLICLHDTGKVEKPCLGELQTFPRGTPGKGECCILPPGPMAYGDTRLPNKTGFFTLFPREVFEEVCPVMVTPSAAQQSALFEICPGYDLNGNELFNISISQSFKEEKDESQSLLGALFHRPRVRQKNLLGIKLEIPEISSSSLRPLDFKLSINSDSGFGSSIKKSMINTLSEDEGFIESDSPLSARCTGIATEDIWDAAMKIPPRACFSWETIGCYSIDKPKPYLSEAGPKAVDMIYQTHQHEMMLMDSSFHFDVPIALSQGTLSRDVISLLIGIPSETFLFINSTSSFEIRRGIYITGMTPESLSKFLSCFIETGSLYRKLEEFSSGSEPGITCTEGLVMQALKDGISRYLQCYRASILSLADKHKEFRILELQQKFRQMCQQIRFVADFCKIKFYPGKCTFTKKLPVGVELLTYLYEKSLELWGQENYLLSLFLLKSASTPYLHFLHEWLFEGVCNDSYNEFHVQQNFFYLHCKDEMYWTKCFLQTTQELSKCVPQFLSRIASDILVCGKSVNLLKLCCPKHYLCSTKAELPPLMLSFSERVVNQIKLTSQQYMDYMLEIAQQEKVTAEQLQKKEEEEKLISLQQASLRRSETLAKIHEQLDEAHKISEEKKQKQMSDLKAQIEENSLLRQLEKEKLLQEENKLIALMEEQQAKEMQIKKEIEAEYQKRALELERREQKAKLLYDKLQKDPTAVKHGALDLKNVLQDSNQILSTENSTDKERNMEETTSSLHHTSAAVSQNEQNDDSVDTASATKETIVLPEVATETTDSPHISTPSLVEKIESNTEYPSQIDTPGQNTDNLSSVQDVLPWQSSQPEFPLSDTNAQIFDSFRKVVKEIEQYAKAARGKKRRSWHEYISVKAAGNANDILLSPSGILFSTDTQTAIRSRGISIHGHASDSTIQDFIYNASPTQTPFKDSCKSPNKLKDNHPNPDKNVEIVKEEMNVKNESFLTRGEGSVMTSKSVENLNFSKKPRKPAIGVRLPKVGNVSEKLGKSLEQSTKPIIMGVRHGSLPSLTHTQIFETQENSSHKCEGELRSHISQTVLKRRGKNVHGHSSDSTIQDVMYSTQNNPEVNNNLDANMSETLGVDTKDGSNADNAKRQSDSPEIPGCVNKNMEISPEDIQNGNTVVNEQSKEGDSCGNRFREMANEAGTPCIDATKTCYDGELLPATYDPTYCKNYSILDKQPLPGLMRNIPKSSSFTAEEDEDIDSCCYTPLLALINRSLLPVIQAQIKLVNKSTIDYFIMNLNINDHFMALRNFFFFHDGEFGHSLSQILFDKVSQCHSPIDLLNPFTLNAILSQALSMSLQGDSVYADQLSFSVKAMPLATLNAVPNVLSCIKLKYKVEWPCNIVITDKNMIYYNSVLELLLKVKQCHWSLTDVWFHLKRDSKSHKLDFSPQYRQLQIYRHEMLHFARVMQSYIASQVLQVTWKEFQNVLENKVNSLDDLRDAHASYLKKACYRCLLSKKAAPVMKIIKDVLSSVLKYRSVLLKYDWVLNNNSGCLEHPAFETLITIYKTFHEHSCFLYKARIPSLSRIWRLLLVTKLHAMPTQHDHLCCHSVIVLRQLVLKRYQPHLKDFLVKLDFNDFYQMAAGNSVDITEDFPS